MGKILKECLECGQLQEEGDPEELVLHPDPREPPLDEADCLCDGCYYVALVDTIDEYQHRIEELEQLKERIDRDWEKKKLTPFNPEGKLQLTYGECLGPAMKITDQKDADQYFHAYVQHVQNALKKEPRTDEMTAEEIVRINLGYYAGYYDTETRIRVEKLFKCAHLIFGEAAKGTPTPKQAFEAGRTRGKTNG